MGYIRNLDTLLSTGEGNLRRLALEIAEAGIRAADPEAVVRQLVKLEHSTLRVGDKIVDVSGGRRIFVIGAGKASYAIAKALDDIIAERIHEGLIICKDGTKRDLRFVRILTAGHPIPDNSSLRAGSETVRVLSNVRQGDVVLSCFTGGSSSLFEQPVEGISLEDIAATTRVLLTCGGNIIEVNDVRKHLSTVKGGKLARSLPAGSQLINLTVSDVIGDRLDYITDPTVPDASSFDDVRAVFDKYDLWRRAPAVVTDYVRHAGAGDETVRAAELCHLHRSDLLLVKSTAACKGAAEAAKAMGITPLLLSTFFEGDSATLGRNFAAIAIEVVQSGNPIAAPCVVIGGGETTVTVKEPGGEGGPNQEFAVGAALELSGTCGIVALGVDTDGTDGPTEYAGAVVDGYTNNLAKAKGVDLYAALERHDVSASLQRIGHAIITGDTGTNVNDLKLVLVSKAARNCPME